jgi:5-methylcytosine-specific restriction endonuclease McrA
MTPIVKLCNVGGCTNVAQQGGYCPAHAAAFAKRTNGRRAKKWAAHKGNTFAWRVLRKQALERDRYRCRLRCSGCTGKATTVHINPNLGGDHSKAKLVDCLSACAHCHGVVDAPRARRST